MSKLVKALLTAVAVLAALPAAAAGEDLVPHRLVDLRRLDALGLMPPTAGIVDKWAEKYGIEIEVVQINDYVESINQYTAGAFDGCVMTNMDALTIPAVGGVDTTALIVGDFSNGNDGDRRRRPRATLEGPRGRPVNLVELSVSHYLLARGARERRASPSATSARVVNTSDADIVAVFTSTADVEHVVTWNPLLAEIARRCPARPSCSIRARSPARSST